MNAPKVSISKLQHEMARELFTAGYVHALNEVADALKVPRNSGVLYALHKKAAAIEAQATLKKIAQATKGKA